MTSIEPPDLCHGSFSDDAPWLIDPTALSWSDGLGVLRLNTRRSVAPLTRASGRIPLGRFGSVATTLVVAVGGWALRTRRRQPVESRSLLAKRLRVAAERLGPTYIKLCQIVSSGEGLFPNELVEEMKRCRDAVPPEPWEVVKRTVEAELGHSLGQTFSTFDPVPIASASIAQVHGATLTDGTEVVVKVQREGIRERVEQDLRVMARIAPLLVGRIPVAALANPPALVEVFAETITEELDFRLEAENMLDIAKVFIHAGDRGYVVPRPHPQLVTRRMLVMERFRGHPFDDVEGIRADGIDSHQVIRIGMQGFTEGAMIFGIFHGDLHGGNLMILRDGRIGLLDHGITARMNPLERNAMLRLLLMGASGDVYGQLEAFRDLGALPPDTDLQHVYTELGLDQEPVDPTTMSQEQLVEEIQRVVKALLSYGAKLPKVLMLYIKNLVFLDGAIAIHAPDLDLVAEFTQLSAMLATRHGEHIATELGVDPRQLNADPEAIKASFGIVDDSLGAVTYEDLRQRREVIRRRLAK